MRDSVGSIARVVIYASALLVLPSACRHDSRQQDAAQAPGLPSAPAVTPAREPDASAPLASSTASASSEPPDSAGPSLTDSGFSVGSARAHGADGRYQIYLLSTKAVLWFSIDLGERSGASFEAARLRDRQTAELVLGDRARNVLPSGPALPPPAPDERHLASGGTVRVDRVGGEALRVSARGLTFDAHPPIDLAPRTVRLSVPPP